MTRSRPKLPEAGTYSGNGNGNSGNGNSANQSPARLLVQLRETLQVCRSQIAQLNGKRVDAEWTKLLKEHFQLLRRSESMTVALLSSFADRDQAETQRDGQENGALQSLTPREREVLVRIAEGQTTKQMAAELGVTIKAIEAHRTRLMVKLRLHSVAHLTRFAVRAGLTSL